MRPSHVVINVLGKPILSGPLESGIGTVRDMSEIATENKVYLISKFDVPACYFPERQKVKYLAVKQCVSGVIVRVTPYAIILFFGLYF